MEMPNREFVEKLQKSDGILGPMSQGTATVITKNSKYIEYTLCVKHFTSTLCKH